MRKKRTYSRRQKALRWTVRLTLVLLILHLTNWYCFLPGRAVEKTLRGFGLSEIQTIHVDWGEFAPMRGKQLRVVRSGNVLAMCAVQFHPIMGWSCISFPNLLDTSDPEYYLYTWDVSKRDKNQEWISLFGFVPEGESAPAFRVGLCDWSEYLKGRDGYLEGQYQEVTPVPTIPVEGGMLYLEQFGFSMPEEQDIVAIATILQDGKWVLPEQRGGTSMG